MTTPPLAPRLRVDLIRPDCLRTQQHAAAIAALIPTDLGKYVYAVDIDTLSRQGAYLVSIVDDASDRTCAAAHAILDDGHARWGGLHAADAFAGHRLGYATIVLGRAFFFDKFCITRSFAEVRITVGGDVNTRASRLFALSGHYPGRVLVRYVENTRFDKHLADTADPMGRYSSLEMRAGPDTIDTVVAEARAIRAGWQAVRRDR